MHNLINKLRDQLGKPVVLPDGSGGIDAGLSVPGYPGHILSKLSYATRLVLFMYSMIVLLCLHHRPGSYSP